MLLYVHLIPILYFLETMIKRKGCKGLHVKKQILLGRHPIATHTSKPKQVVQSGLPTSVLSITQLNMRGAEKIQQSALRSQNLC
ncbi:hypothetical protein H671_6g17078 [Cricetulus griseus]|uniref:Uncharacterized protein n=1 Tax=Cricetulus griseus TaxID=10029 RepID=A0A061HYH4_CRIGR|nr:hypothetical protein H671_6g17078 [Cricetulus griseus]